MGKRGSSRADDSRTVLSSAELLGLSEFDLFVHAYQAWFGDAPNHAIIERVFLAYLLDDVAPFWVRHFVHDILSRDDAGAPSSGEGTGTDANGDCGTRVWQGHAGTLRLALRLLLPPVALSLRRDEGSETLLA